MLDMGLEAEGRRWPKLGETRKQAVEGLRPKFKRQMNSTIRLNRQFLNATAAILLTGLMAVTADTNNITNAVEQSSVIWRFGTPTRKTNKLSFSLPAKLPPNTPQPAALAPEHQTNSLELGRASSNNLPATALSPTLSSNTTFVVWQFGVPTLRTNKFNPLLPSILPPPVPIHAPPDAEPPKGESNQPNPRVAQSQSPVPLYGAPPASTGNIIWLFGAPTLRTNKFVPTLPTNLPPPDTNSKSPPK